jgi:hypothetical protein
MTVHASDKPGFAPAPTPPAAPLPLLLLLLDAPGCAIAICSNQAS